MSGEGAPDAATAAAFANSWNHVPEGSVYTRAQFKDWLAPLDLESLRGQSVLELGFGNGSLLYHMGQCGPARLAGVELADTLETARANLAGLDVDVELHPGDLTRVELGVFDFVYCIGVLHHLQSPTAGFEAMLRHTRPGGRFHGWVYAKEGNGLIRAVVEPLRRIGSRLPWWFTKYAMALPAVLPYFVYAKLLSLLYPRWLPDTIARKLPLRDYSLWIAERELGFFHHVAFDQLVTPRTVYLSRAEIDAWLAHDDVAPSSSYVVFRNGNSWKFGGRRRK